jgi:hypothetical protein
MHSIISNIFEIFYFLNRVFLESFNTVIVREYVFFQLVLQIGKFDQNLFEMYFIQFGQCGILR